MAARVLRSWSEDFVDEDTGEVVSIERNEIVIERDTIIEKDGVEISRSYHRHVCEPDHDCTNEDQRVKNVANAVHTPAVKTAWKEFKASQATN